MGWEMGKRQDHVSVPLDEILVIKATLVPPCYLGAGQRRVLITAVPSVLGCLDTSGGEGEAQGR